MVISYKSVSNVRFNDLIVSVLTGGRSFPPYPYKIYKLICKYWCHCFLSVNFRQTPFYQYTLFSENFQFFFNIMRRKCDCIWIVKFSCSVKLIFQILKNGLCVYGTCITKLHDITLKSNFTFSESIYILESVRKQKKE